MRISSFAKTVDFYYTGFLRKIQYENIKAREIGSEQIQIRFRGGHAPTRKLLKNRAR